ncbi:MAG: MEKHLA domain-containing protein [Methylophilaceae bacterium]
MSTTWRYDCFQNSALMQPFHAHPKRSAVTMLNDHNYLADYQDANFLRTHVRRLMQSYQHWIGHALVERTADTDPVEAVMHSEFAIASHRQSDDPKFNFANLRALALFKMQAEQLIGLPSRYSAEPMLRADRDKFLQQVSSHGFVQNYAGIRIAQDGSRFEIQGATVWNVFDPEHADLGVLGQAVIIRSVRPV